MERDDLEVLIFQSAARIFAGWSAAKGAPDVGMAVRKAMELYHEVERQLDVVFEEEDEGPDESAEVYETNGSE